MGKYLILIYDDVARREAADTSEVSETQAAHGEFIRTHGVAVRGGARLDDPDTATSIRRRGDGSLSVTDGTFIETKEVLGGYYLIEAADLDVAMSIAAAVPAPYGGVEVRPVVG